MNIKEKLIKLIEIKAQLKTLADQEKEIKDSLLEDDFEKESVEGIVVSKKQRTTITMIKDADLNIIRQKYPELCNIIPTIDIKKLTPEQFSEAKVLYSNAYYEDIIVDAKELHQISKEFTEQKLTTYIEVKGL